MASSVNKVILIGNVGRDPEARAMQDGTKVVHFSLATSETWNDKASGERKERTEWHRVVIFNDRIAEVVEKYVRKGSSVFVEGSLQTRKWTDKDGQEKSTAEVVITKFRGDLTMLGRAGEAGDAQESASTGQQQRASSRPPPPRQAPQQRNSNASPSSRPTNGPQWDARQALPEDEIPF